MAKHQIPQGYQEQSGDIVGFWGPKGDGKTRDWENHPPIHMIPRYVRLFDSQIDDRKVSALLIVELVDPVILSDPKDNDIEVRGKVGDLVGIWVKPGMRGLSNLAGIKVYMFQEGELDTGKPNAMPLFKCMSAGRAGKIPVEMDGRERSRRAKTPIPFLFLKASGDSGGERETEAEDPTANW